MQPQELIEHYRDDMVRSLQACIRIPSVYADDQSGFPFGQAVQDCLCLMLELARKMGFAAQDMDGRLGWCEYGQGEEMIAVLGHLDVVPAGAGWSVPPYGGTVAEGRIYGRGAIDDKGPVIAALYALLALKESGIALKRRIRLFFGLNEETGSADIPYYLERGGEIPVMGITPDSEYPVINGEKGIVTQSFAHTLRPCGTVRLQSLSGGSAHNVVPDAAVAVLACPPETAAQIAALRAGKISCTPTADGVRIEARGKSAHGGSPGEGENAIGRLLLFLARLPLEGDLAQAVGFLAARIGMEYDGRSLGVAMADACSGPLTLNLGVIRGDAHGLEVKLNYRYPVTRRFSDCGDAVTEAFLGAGFSQTGIQHKACIYMPPESELVQALMRVYTDYTGETPAPKCIGGGTYAKLMPNTLAFGPVFPGDEMREHKPDEFIEISRLLDNARLLAAAMCALAG